MPSIAQPGIERLLRNRPDHELAIRRLYRHDAEFRAICDDYGLVLQALESCQTYNRMKPGRVEEYHRMLEELTEEVLTFLEQRGGTQGSRSGS